jgi:hypothetical protein
MTYHTGNERAETLLAHVQEGHPITEKRHNLNVFVLFKRLQLNTKIPFLDVFPICHLNFPLSLQFITRNEFQYRSSQK